MSQRATLAAVTDILAGKIWAALQRGDRNRAAGWWYGPHMAAASRAIAQRIPLVDIVLEVRDARVPLASQFEQLKGCPPSSRRVVVLNKMDLANREQVKEWMCYMEDQNQICHCVNSHNNESIKKFLNFLQAHIRQLKKTDSFGSTITLMLVGVPNVGKSALVNSLHKVGRIGAAEKGKLKHATISPLPCETKDISSYKIASNPNIYVLDTPGVLPPVINDAEISSKLALIGTLEDSLVGEKELAMYFLSILNSSEEYKKWGELLDAKPGKVLADCHAAHTSSLDLEMKRKRQYATDHTQDFVVNDVRRTLYEEASSFQGELADIKNFTVLAESQLEKLADAFRIPQNIGEESCAKVYPNPLEKWPVKYIYGRMIHFFISIYYLLEPIRDELNENFRESNINMQAIKDKIHDMTSMRKAKADAKAEEKAEKDLAKAKMEVAHEVRLAREAEAKMDMHVDKADQVARQEISKHSLSNHPTSYSAGPRQ